MEVATVIYIKVVIRVDIRATAIITAILHPVVVMEIAVNLEATAPVHLIALVRQVPRIRVIVIVQTVINQMVVNQPITAANQMIHIMQRIMGMRKIFMMTIMMILMDMKMPRIIMMNGESKVIL